MKTILPDLDENEEVLVTTEEDDRDSKEKVIFIEDIYGKLIVYWNIINI